MIQNKEIPQGYKDSPLGIIPQEWEVKRLGEVGEIINGLTYSPDDICEDGILVLRSSNIFNRQIVLEDTVFVKTNVYNQVQKNDILICVRNGSRGLIGKNALINVEENMTFGAFMALFRSDYYRYVFQLFDTQYYYKQVYRNLGATINSINNNDLKKFIFPLPPLPEQQKIAEILTCWDETIEKQSQLIEKLETRKRGIMQQLLTGKKRLKGFEGEWRMVKLRDVCAIVKGEQLNKIELETKGNYPSYSGGIMPSGYTDDWNTDENTIIISEGGNSCGYVNFIKIKFWSGGHCYSLQQLNHNINKEFLFQLLKYRELSIMILRVGSGLPNIQKKDLECFKLYIPSLSEQTAIANILSSADKEIEKEKAKLASLRLQKKGLMQVLLTGKKRVKI